MMSVITIAVWVGGISQPVIEQPGVSLGVSISISSGLGLSLLYGLHSLLLRSGSGSRNKAVGEDTVSAGDSGTIIVLAANRGGVDQGGVIGKGCVVNVGESVVDQGSSHCVGKPGLGLGLSSSIGGN